MKYLKLYRFFESSQDEIDRILDKISQLGINSLTPKEKSILDGNEEADTNSPVSFDKDGNILVDGKPPLYKNVDKPKDIKSTDSQNKSFKNFSTYLSTGNKCHLIKENNEFAVFLEKYLIGAKRIYYITFKKVVDSQYFFLLHLFFLSRRLLLIKLNNFKILIYNL